MNNLYRYLQIAFLLMFLMGCAKKGIYKFAQPLGSFGNAEKVSKKENYKKKPKSSEIISTTVAPLPAKEIMFSAALSGDFPAKPNPLTALPGRKIYPNSNQVKPPASVNQRIPKKFKPLQKVKRINADLPDDKPIHKFASLGLILVIVGWIMALIALFSGGAALLLLLAFILFIAGFFTSIKGLSEIKKAPEQYGGKAAAKAGIILSGLVLLALVAFIFYLLAFAGAFS